MGMTAAYAATSYDAFNTPDMFLNVGITGTATTGIDIAPPVRNGVVVTYPATTGAILKIQQGSREELLYYSTATVNSTTKVITLSGVIRDVCWNNAREILTCGSGKIFSKGASVRFVDAAQLLNLKANIDRTNTFTSVNAIRFSGSGSLGQPTFATTAVRDQQLGSMPATGSGLVACVIAEGLCYDGIGGTWVARGSNSTPNATATTSGKGELAIPSDIQNHNTIGDSSGPLLLTAGLATTTSTGSTQAYKIPALGADGQLDASLFSTIGSVFGDGSSGSGTISSNTTLTSDKYYTNLTVGTGVTLKTNGYRIFVNNVLTNYGTIAQNGNNGSGGTVGAAGSAGTSAVGGYRGTGALISHAAGTLPASLPGANGGNGGAGVATGNAGTVGAVGSTGASETSGVCVGRTGSGTTTGTQGKIGGSGGTDGQAGGLGGAGGGSGTTTINNQRLFYNAFSTFTSITTVKTIGCMAASGGGGGGGGGGNNAGSGRSGAGGGGGGSGSNGGNMEIHARIIRGPGNITAIGGNGGNGGDGGTTGGANKGGGGGGAPGNGGQGGFITLIYQTIVSYTGTINVSGGTPGTAGVGGAIAGGGTAGSNGPAAISGQNGVLMSYQIK